MGTIRIYSEAVYDVMDFAAMLTHMNIIGKPVDFWPARLPVYKLQVPEGPEKGRSTRWLVKSLGAFKNKEPISAYRRTIFDKPFYFTAIPKGMTDPVFWRGEPVRLTKMYDIDVWIGADSRSEFKEKFIKGVALLNTETGECFGSVTPEFMMDRGLSIDDIEVGRGIHVGETTFEVISAQEAADFKCLEIPSRTPKERRASDGPKSSDRARYAISDMASGSCRIRAYGTLDQLSQLKRDLADGVIGSSRFDNSTPVMTATENCMRLSYSAMVRLRGIQKESLRTYGDQKKANPFYFIARAQREASGLTRSRSFGMSGYDVDIFCGAVSRSDFIRDRIKHKALLDPKTHECVGAITPEFLMNYRIPIKALNQKTIDVPGRTLEIILAQEAADFECLEIQDRLPEPRDNARLRALASTLHVAKRTNQAKRHHTTCARCGRIGLVRTVPIRQRDGSTAYLGSSCAQHVRKRR